MGTRSRWPRTGSAGFTLAVLLTAAPPLQAAETVRVGGTGIGLGFAHAVAEHVAAADPATRIEVLPSLGTSGGIKALLAGDVAIAIATRVPNAEERAKGLHEGACLTTAMVFATSRPSAPGIMLSQLPAIYLEPGPLWPDGQPLKVILRARGGTEVPYLVKLVPDMESAFAEAYRRRGVPTGATDQDNAELAHRTAGSFAIMTLLQIGTEKLPVTPLAVNGVLPGPATLADRTYPMPMPVCFLLAAAPAGGAVKFIEAVRSPAGRDLARLHGAILSE